MSRNRSQSSGRSPLPSTWRSAAGLALAALLWSPASLAAPGGQATDAASPGGGDSPSVRSPIPPSIELVSVPARGNRAGLQLRRDGDRLLAATCRTTCAWDSAIEMKLPPLVASALTPSHAVQVDIGKDRGVVHVKVPVEESMWEAIVAAPLEASAPLRVVFSGWTGLVTNETGERQGTAIQRFSRDDGKQDIVVGSLHDGVSLCGRPLLLHPKALFASDLELHAVRLLRPGEDDRRGAVDLTATEVPSLGASVGRARVASSAKGAPSAASDGDPKTVWSEDRNGDGSGEFLIFSTPAAIAVSGFAWQVRAKEEAAEAAAPALGVGTEPAGLTNASTRSGAAPKQFWVVTDDSVYRVNTDRDAWAEPGLQLGVQLPQAESTSCVAVILDTAFSSSNAVDVTFAEFAIQANIEDDQVATLIDQLDEPDAAGDRAVTALASLGRRAVSAVRKRYVRLTPIGRARALQIYDALPCEVSVSGYVRAIRGEQSGEERHAGERLRQCSEESPAALARALKRTNARRTEPLALLLAELDPARLVRAAVVSLDGAQRARRAALRAAIHRVAAAPEARSEILAQLASAELSVKAAIDLLRGLDDRIELFQPLAGQRLVQLLTDAPDYRTRYLLIEPLTRLSRNEPRASEALGRLLSSDPLDPVRAQAARLVEPSQRLAPLLVRAVTDPQVRVREAAVTNLGERRYQPARDALIQRLMNDEWPLVRAASVRALARYPLDPAIDAALAESVEEDDSPTVRRPALLALGKRQARSELPTIRERLEDEDEDPYVRAAAAATLGTLCDRQSADALAGYANAITTLSGSEASRIVGRAALSALGRLALPDLRERLAEFEGPEVPGWARRAAEAATEHPEPCSR